LRLTLFDVDGTLVNAGGAGRWALERAFEVTFGVEDAAAFSGKVRFNGRTDPVIVADIAALAGVPAPDLLRRKRDLEEAYLGLLEERLGQTRSARALPGVKPLLDALGGREVAVGLLTGNVERGARLKLRAVDLDRYFDGGAFGSDHEDRIELGRLARERFASRLGRRIDPREVVVIGDAVEDVRAARVNGYRCLAVASGWTEKEALVAEEPDLLLEDLSDTEIVVRWIEGRPPARPA